MGFMDKIKNMMNVPEEDDDFDFEEQENNLDYSEAKHSSESTDYFSDSSARKAAPKKSNVVKYNNSSSQLQVVLMKPDSFADATTIADHLNSKRTVVLNLESSNRETSRRLVDFLSGVAYANQGQLKRVANSTFIITPFNVDIMGDAIIDELENSGLYV